MKKSYTTPSVKVHHVKITNILEGSSPLKTPVNAVGNGSQLSNQMGSIIDDDEE